ncbi:Bacterial surface proteins containing Ig-like domains [Desulfitobacterium sp. LBE]|uniref:leucine-rich repeat protein n=1 Tax=Desulfitobacterium sp. LBE TaxID=884086 RepID=UPI00119AC259|nr:leucine-rich repeat protein [Desulfitobacterium sp. LBE]TWH57574.1 Bacterial surface proteins containing Ig-like domains [Desulfitobacterium sp. LBE]
MQDKAIAIKKKKKLFLAALLLAFFLPAGVGADEAQTAPAGGNLTGIVYDNGSFLKYKAGTAGITITACDQAATRIDIPDYIEGKPVTNIAREAFSGCRDLTEIRLPDTLRTIGYAAFAGCQSLTGINLPEGLEQLGGQAFRACGSLREVNIPASLKDFNLNTFGSNGDIRFAVAEENPVYTCRDGVIYTKDGKTLVRAGIIGSDSFVVPDPVTEISSGAFFHHPLTTITLGSNLKTIGPEAFSGCLQLEEVNLNEGLKSIGDKAFKDCLRLGEILFNEGLESIGANAFEGTAALKEIVLPAGLTSLGQNAFKGSGLEKADLAGSGLETLPYGTFWDCVRLQDITLGDRITVIEDSAFRNCTFTEITLPAQLRQLKSSFTGCAELESITFPYTLKSLGSGVFAGCTALKAVYFEGNMPLRGDGPGTSVPNEVWTRENDSFSGLPLAVAEKLKIYVLAGARGWENSFKDFAEGWGATSRIPFVYPVEYYTLEREAEQDNPRLILHAPESFAHLETGSTAEVPGLIRAGLPTDAGPILWSSSDPSVAAVDDSGRVTVLQAGVSVITATLIYKGTLYIGEVEVRATGPESPFTWSVQRDGTAIINGFREGIGEGAMTDLEIPRILGGYTVGAIRSHAFAQNPSIRRVRIPGTVQTIGNNAFYYCALLREVILEEGIRDIGVNAFAGTGIRELVVPQSVTWIQDAAFAGCQELQSATVKSSNLEYPLGIGVFRDSRSLTEVTLAEGITATGGYTFAGCASLESITLPSTLQALNMYDFSGCSNLKTVELQGYLMRQETGITENYNPFAALSIDFIRGIDNKHIKYDYQESKDLVILHPADGNDWGSLFNSKVRTGVRDAFGNIQLDTFTGFPTGNGEPALAANPGGGSPTLARINWGSAPPVDPGTQPSADTAGEAAADSKGVDGEKEGPKEETATVLEIVKKTVAENPWLTMMLGIAALTLVALGGAGRIQKYRQSR